MNLLGHQPREMVVSSAIRVQIIRPPVWVAKREFVGQRSFFGIRFERRAEWYFRAVVDRSGQIYWAHAGAGTIQRADLDGGHVVTVLTGLDRPEAIALSIVPEPSSHSLAYLLSAS